MKPGGWALAAAVAVPALAWASASAVNGDAADALLRTSALLVIAAPIAGVDCVSRLKQRGTPGRRPLAVLVTVAAWVALAVTTSALLSGAALGLEAIAFVASSHAAIGCVTLALAALGALAAALLDDPLDAAACGVVAAVVTGGGLLVAGSWIGNSPPALLTLAIDGSPFIAMASAARIDVVRLDLFYRISPLAHLGVEYPSWSATCGWYTLIAAACLTGAAARSARRQSLEV